MPVRSWWGGHNAESHGQSPRHDVGPRKAKALLCARNGKFRDENRTLQNKPFRGPDLLSHFEISKRSHARSRSVDQHGTIETTVPDDPTIDLDVKSIQ